MIDDGLALSRWLLSWLPPEAQTVLALPVLIGLLAAGLILLVRMFPAIDRVVGPLGSGVATGIGMLVLLPEFLVTRALRAGGRRPPAVFHTYGDGVENLVLMGHRLSRAGLAGFTRNPRTRRPLIFAALAAILFIGNAHGCPPAPASCTRPMAAWWQQTSTIFANLGEPEVKPTKKPTKKATRKPKQSD